jgi:hypothetical protein
MVALGAAGIAVIAGTVTVMSFVLQNATPKANAQAPIVIYLPTPAQSAQPAQKP